MIYVTYATLDGSLVDISSTLPTPNPAHCTRAIDADSVDVSEWNTQALRFDDESRANSAILSKLEYLRRFTSEERVTIRQAAKVTPVLEDYLSLLELADEINTGDADTIAAVNMLEQAGLIAQGRAAEVLA